MNIFKWCNAVIAITVLTAAAGCVTSPTIHVDRDPQADVSRYRTFGFFEPLGTDKQGYESLLSQRLKDATREEMERHGYRFDQINPDLLVNFGARLSNRIRITRVPGDRFGYWGYWHGLYRPWIGYDETQVEQYREGTLVIDLVDANRKELVWQGRAVGRVTDTTMDHVAKAVRGAVADILERLPRQEKWSAGPP